MSEISPKPGSVSTIIRSYKSAVTRHARKINPNFAWQSRFWDHVIRNDSSFQKIRQYIINNPKKWEIDRFYKNKV
jgi:REP element-mobilizing transposase RayT